MVAELTLSQEIQGNPSFFAFSLSFFWKISLFPFKLHNHGPILKTVGSSRQILGNFECFAVSFPISKAQRRTCVPCTNHKK